MMKKILEAERKAKVHADAASALSLAFCTQWANEDLPLEEWECTMKKLDKAEAKAKGRYDALNELRRSVTYTVERKSDYERMKDSWFKYCLMLKDFAA